MSIKYLYLWLLIMGCALLRTQDWFWQSTIDSKKAYRDLRRLEDAESILAMGKRLAFSQVNRWELSLIPGVSDRIGKELLESREILQATAYAFSEEQDWRALQVINGLGPIKSRSVGNFLDLRR